MGMSVKSCSIEPIDDRIVAIRKDSETVTPGGVVIPDQAKEKSRLAKVIAVGPGRLLENGERMKMSINPGDNIMFGEYAGVELSHGGVTYLVLREQEVLVRISV